MKTENLAVLAGLAGLAAAGPVRLHRREVPQEHSHQFILDLTQKFLLLNNPNEISDSVFGLLGNAAAAAGAGKITNLDCLKQATADQAFTNAKAVADVGGMAGALMYQAIERNTGGVGVKSALCTETPVNPEIGAFSQHQDPASDGAAANNKAVTLELAKQLALIGADPLLALDTGTFAPGLTSDNTGKGNSCDTDPDPLGCIFTLKTLVLDATPDEVSAAVSGIQPTFTGTGAISATQIDFSGLSVAGGGAAAAAAAPTPAAAPAAVPAAAGGKGKAKGKGKGKGHGNAAAAATITAAAAGSAAAAAAAPPTASACTVVTMTMTPEPAASAAAEEASAAAPAPEAASGTNVQAFTGTLGGAAPPVVSVSGAARPFTVSGDTFVGEGAAIMRSCSEQHNACASQANSGAISGGVGQCDAQLTACNAANNIKRRRNFLMRDFAPVRRQSAGEFGSCSDPSIAFKDGLADRQGFAFIANNLADFNHGSALKIGVISDFICQGLQSRCKASAAVVSKCNDASTAAKAATQDQTAADTFNNLLGVGAGGGAAAASAPAPTAAPAAAEAAAAQVVTVTNCA